MIIRRLLQRVLVLILLTTAAQSRAALSEGLCLPKGAEARGWPVCAIYMHGLFGGKFREGQFEEPFRANFEKTARDKGCRIAVPFGNPGRNGDRNWIGVPMAEMRRRAENACGGSKFVAKPSIIGFSAGANWLRKQGCGSLAGYSPVTLVGPTNVYTKYVRAKNRRGRLIKKAVKVKISNAAIKKCSVVFDDHKVPSSPTMYANAVSFKPVTRLAAPLNAPSGTTE